LRRWTTRSSILGLSLLEQQNYIFYLDIRNPV